ncbi:MAG: hypothetical protein IKN55_07750 [Oscillospiraceae bacterium]|nr:hypothetical protein [Oscillospiraceae bacterium]
METLRFYDELPPMECFSGDTLPAFEIKPEGITGFSAGSMVMLVEEHQIAGAVALCKAAGFVEDTVLGQHFRVQLTSEDTSQLCGTYRLHFILTVGGTDYEKLTGTLHVRRKVRAAS